jgi:hypothetical protein
LEDWSARAEGANVLVNEARERPHFKLRWQLLRGNEPAGLLPEDQLDALKVELGRLLAAEAYGSANKRPRAPQTPVEVEASTTLRQRLMLLRLLSRGVALCPENILVFPHLHNALESCVRHTGAHDWAKRGSMIATNFFAVPIPAEPQPIFEVVLRGAAVFYAADLGFAVFHM